MKIFIVYFLFACCVLSSKAQDSFPKNNIPYLETKGEKDPSTDVIIEKTIDFFMKYKSLK